MDNLIRMIFRAIKPICFAEGDGGAGGDGGGGDGRKAAEGSSATAFSWKSQLSPDFANSATMQKFPDTKEGFNDAVKSHLNLEQMLGHQKVPVPKDENDKEAWNLFSKAMGIPDKADGYGLEDAQVPESLKGMTIDKQKFAEIVHAHKLTPGQAKGLWKAYTEMTMASYQKVMTDRKAQMTEVANRLRGEWGDAYDTNVELGQMVINKFSSDKEMQDFVTASILQNPMGAKFLAKIGNQFAENKFGEFGYKRFSLTPDQAKDEWYAIINDPKDPYNDDKANPEIRQRRIDYVNNLISISQGGSR